MNVSTLVLVQCPSAPVFSLARVEEDPVEEDRGLISRTPADCSRPAPPLGVSSLLSRSRALSLSFLPPNVTDSLVFVANHYRMRFRI